MNLSPRENAPQGKLKLLRISDVIDLTGLPKSTIYLKIKNREFPTQLSIGARSVAWLENEIQEWIASNINRKK